MTTRPTTSAQAPADAGNRPISITSHSPGETATLGERLGALLEAGDVLLLEGELGAGKTCLTQGIARGLGISDLVCSPTFVLVGEYQGRLRLFHADLYRLDNPAEVEALDLSHTSEAGVLVVEWPERAPQFLPRGHLLLRLSHRGADEREIELMARGHRAALVLGTLLDEMSSASSQLGN